MKNCIAISIMCLMLSTFSQANVELYFNYQVSEVVNQPDALPFVADEKREHLLSGYQVYSQGALFGKYKDIKIPVQVALIIDGNLSWQDEGIFSRIVFSNNGQTVLFVKKYEDGEDYIVYHGGQLSIVHQRYPSPRAIGFLYDSEPLYQVSNKGDAFLKYKWRADGGLNNIQMCRLKQVSESCKTLEFTLNSPIGSIALVNALEVATVTTEIDKSEEKGKPVFTSNSQLRLYSHDSIKWEISLPNGDQWENASINVYDDLLIITTSFDLRVYSIQYGNLLWEFETRNQNIRYKPLIESYIKDGYIILPFADNSGFSRKALSTIQ